MEIFFQELSSVNTVLHHSTRGKNGYCRDVNECRVAVGHTAPLGRPRPLVELT